MSRLVALALVLASTLAFAGGDDPVPTGMPASGSASGSALPDDLVAPVPSGSAVLSPPLPSTLPGIVAVPVAPPDLSDQAIGVELGLAAGGRVTPGGLRIEGHYLYQLSDRDWFDGTAGFTFGGGGAACFRDRSDTFICDHGFMQGDGASVAASVRHFMTGQGKFWPFLAGGIGLGLVHFSDDAVSGLAIPLHVGGGIRASITSSIAFTAEGRLEVGFGAFDHSLGAQPEFGVALVAGVEFKL